MGNSISLGTLDLALAPFVATMFQVLKVLDAEVMKLLLGLEDVWLGNLKVIYLKY